MVSSEKILAAAEKTAKWFLVNQPQSRLNANRGRFLTQHDAALADPEELPYSTSWDTGCSLCGLLALWKRTGKKEYLEAAEKGGHYIMSLQVLDTREKQFFGAFREVTPQSMEFCPRDATSAAWALIYLAEATGDKEYLYRARIFGDWMLEYAAGIRRGSAPGTFRLAPVPDPTGGVRKLKASVQTVRGCFESSWEILNNRIVYDFTVPAGVITTLTLRGKEQTLKSGNYHYEEFME